LSQSLPVSFPHPIICGSVFLQNEFSYLKLIASHDLDFVWDTCDRTILLSEGRIVCDGDTREILSDRKLLEAHGLELPLSLYRK